MFPLNDLNPTRRFPILTYTLLAANILVFFWQLGLSERELQIAFMRFSVVPAELARLGLLHPESLRDIFRSMFFHGGWMHLAGNILYLYLFADNVEDYLGKLLFLIVYFGSGFAAVVAQFLIDPTSRIPLVGASGAIAGVLGSYLILYPGVRVRGVIPLGIFPIFTTLPAWIVLSFWFIAQVFNGTASLGPSAGMGGGVAFFAHIGGFIVGFMLTLFLTLVMPVPPAQNRTQMLYERADYYRGQ